MISITSCITSFSEKIALFPNCLLPAAHLHIQVCLGCGEKEMRKNHRFFQEKQVTQDVYFPFAQCFLDFKTVLVFLHPLSIYSMNITFVTNWQCKILREKRR